VPAGPSPVSLGPSPVSLGPSPVSLGPSLTPDRLSLARFAVFRLAVFFFAGLRFAVFRLAVFFFAGLRFAVFRLVVFLFAGLRFAVFRLAVFFFAGLRFAVFRLAALFLVAFLRTAIDIASFVPLPLPKMRLQRISNYDTLPTASIVKNFHIMSNLTGSFGTSPVESLCPVCTEKSIQLETKRIQLDGVFPGYLSCPIWGH